MMTWHRY